MRTVALRYFNAAGADPAGGIGEAHEQESHLIPLIFQTALGIRSTFKIFGTDYETPDGTCIRDFVHVTDIARAHLLALEKIDHLPRVAYNLVQELEVNVPGATIIVRMREEMADLRHRVEQLLNEVEKSRRG